MPASGAWGQATRGSSKGGGGLGLILPYEHCAALRRICMGGCCSACRGVWGGNTEPACSPPFTSEGLDSIFFFSVAPPLTAAVKLIKSACCLALCFLTVLHRAVRLFSTSIPVLTSLSPPSLVESRAFGYILLK